MSSFWESSRAARFNLILYICAAVAVTLKHWFMGPVSIDRIDFPVAAYNNFLIFKWSGFNLINELPLYIGNDLHYDLFKYSPTCAMGFLPFYMLPTEIGLLLWNMLNLLLPLWALHQILGLNAKSRNILALFLLAEGITSLLNAQSNGLVLGLLLLAIGALQREKTGKAVFWILISGFIKIFGWVFFLIFLIRPKVIPKAILYGGIYTIILVLAPLALVNYEYLISEYRWWLLLLQQDSGTYLKLSFMGWFQAWFRVLPPKNIVLILGLLVQIFPLWLFLRAKKDAFLQSKQILRYGASLLVWAVLFNHMSESATYVIAIGGIVLFFSGEALERPSVIWLILGGVLAFAILGPTDIYPKAIRYWIVERAQLKAFTVLIAYLYILRSLYEKGPLEKSRPLNENIK